MPRKSFPILFWLSGALFLMAGFVPYGSESAHPFFRTLGFLLSCLPTFAWMFLVHGLLNLLGNYLAAYIPLGSWHERMGPELPWLYTIVVAVTLILWLIAVIVGKEDPWVIVGCIFFLAAGSMILFLRGFISTRTKKRGST